MWLHFKNSPLLDDFRVHFRRFLANRLYQFPRYYQFPLSRIHRHAKIMHGATFCKALKPIQFARYVVQLIFGGVRGFLALEGVILRLPQFCESGFFIGPQWIDAGRRQFLAILVRPKVGIRSFP